MSGGRSGVLAVLAALVLAAPAGAAAPGAVEDLTWGAESGEDAAALDARQQRTVDKTVEAGARWVRLTVNWADAQPRDPKDPTVADPYDQWYLAHYESAVAKARAAGLNVIVVIGTSPVWASGTTNTHPSLQDHYPPLNASDYANFVGFIAGRFRGRVQAYEIWNEQNLQRFWHTPTGLPDPQGYATLLRAAYLKVKAADPNAKVVYGGLAGNDWQFVEASYDAPSGGVKGSFDVMATHPYTYCGQTAPEDYGGGNPIGDGTGARIPKDRFPAYREVRASMLARADEKPIWFTEFGWSSWTTASGPGACIANPADWLDGGVDEATQADFLTRSFNFLATDPYVEVATWYQFRDNFWLEGDPADREAHFGLLKVDFSEKPAYRAFKANATSTRPRTYAQTVRATDALAGWWRLNEAATAGTQAVDGRTIGLAGYPSSTPNPYTGGGIGVYTGGVAQGATSLLASDGLPSARLDGVDDFIRVPDRAPLDPGHAMTLEAWVKPSDLTGARHILAKADSYYLKATGPDLEFGWWTTGGTLRFAWAGEQLQVGRTNHVVATSDGRDSRIYVNGVQVASQPATGKVRATISPLYAGAYAQGATWAGQIDEPAVYTRALSADEIALHYRKGTFNTRIDSGPPATTTSTTATFTFSSQPGATYQCTLDTGAPTACTSPATYGNVPAGTHTLSVRATDTGGLSDSTPAKRTWTVAAP